MANQEHLALLRQGVTAWNAWRQANTDLQPDLSEADLSEASLRRVNLADADLREAAFVEADLSGADLSEAVLVGAILAEANFGTFGRPPNRIKTNLTEANLRGAHLFRANLTFADLSRANLHRAHLAEADLFGTHLEEVDLSEANLVGARLIRADLSRANLEGAELYEANLQEANLSGAKLVGANLQGAFLNQTNCANADLTGCSVYGTSTWDVNLDGATQANLMITPEGQPTITVDNLEVAQFIYLLLNNAKIRDVIDTIASKVVLVLGRFTNERKMIPDAIREELRKHNYLPVLFDFDKPASRNLTETMSTLAHMARFIIADISDAKSIPHPARGTLLLYTDGVTEALDMHGSFFEAERLYDVACASRETSAQELCERLLQAVTQYRGAALQADDVTLVAVRAQ